MAWQKKRSPLTKEGTKLEAELEYLKSFRRQEVAERIKQAIAFGDITKLEYEDAKNEQALLRKDLTLKTLKRRV